jgi:hypothetical protein
MKYTVIIRYQDEEARLECSTVEEARMVRQSFVNWGGMGYDISVEESQ